MTEWKRRQLEKKRLEEEFAKVAFKEFTAMYIEKTFGANASKKEMQEVVKVCSEASWSVARVMVKARAG